MRKLFALAAVLSLLGMASTVYADGCPTAVSPTTPYACTTTVFNDTGSAVTSGSVVIWDNDDTEFDRTGYPYVTTTTTADSDHIAGVMVTGSCPDQALCEIVTFGWAKTRIAGSTDDATEDTRVSTSSVAGEAGDHGDAADVCSLGVLLEDRDLNTGATFTADNGVGPVWVNPSCR